MSLPISYRECFLLESMIWLEKLLMQKQQAGPGFASLAILAFSPIADRTDAIDTLQNGRALRRGLG